MKKILQELKEIKKLLQVIASNSEQNIVKNIYLSKDSVDPEKIPSIDVIRKAKF